MNDIKFDELIKEIVNQYSESEKEELESLKEKCKTEFKTNNENVFFYEGNRFTDSIRESLTGEDKKRNEEELKHAIVLADKLFKIFMPLENHSLQKKKNFDAILNNLKIDFKYLRGNSLTTLRSQYQKGLNQASSVSYFIPSDKTFSKKEIKANLLRAANGVKKKKFLIFIYFEKDDTLTILDVRNLGKK